MSAFKLKHPVTINPSGKIVETETGRFIARPEDPAITAWLTDLINEAEGKNLVEPLKTTEPVEENKTQVDSTTLDKTSEENPES